VVDFLKENIETLKEALPPGNIDILYTAILYHNGRWTVYPGMAIMPNLGNVQSFIHWLDMFDSRGRDKRGEDMTYKFIHFGEENWH